MIPRASVLLAVMLAGCGSAAAPVAEPVRLAAEPEPGLAGEEVSYALPELPDGCFATACERAYAECLDAEVETDCDGPFGACIAEACDDILPIEIEPPELADVLFSIGEPEGALAACPPESDEVSCQVLTCAATRDNRHEACVAEIQSMEEEGTTYALAVRDGRHWARVVPVFGRAVSPASMTSSWVDEPELHWTEGEGGPWLTLRWRAGFTDADWCSGAGGSDEMIALCGPEGGRTVCAAALRTSARGEASLGRIELVEDADQAERDECYDEYSRRALELERWTHAQPIVGVLLAPDGTVVWLGAPPDFLAGISTLADLRARAEGLRTLGER